MSADGMTTSDIAAIQDHLALLRTNDLVPTRHGILQNLLVANGAACQCKQPGLGAGRLFSRNVDGACAVRTALRRQNRRGG